MDITQQERYILDDEDDDCDISIFNSLLQDDHHINQKNQIFKMQQLYNQSDHEQPLINLPQNNHYKRQYQYPQNECQEDEQKDYKYNEQQDESKPTLEDIQYTISKIKRFLPDNRVIFVIEYFFKQWIMQEVNKFNKKKKNNDIEMESQSKQIRELSQKLNYNQKDDFTSNKNYIQLSNKRQLFNNIKIKDQSKIINNTSRHDLSNDNSYISKLSNTSRARAFTIKQKQSAAKLLIQPQHLSNPSSNNHSKVQQSNKQKSIIQSSIEQESMKFVSIQAYKSLQSCLAEQFHHQIIHLNWIQLSNLQPFFANYSLWPSQQLSTFIKFIKRSTYLQEIIVNQYQTWSVYKLILEKMYELTKLSKYILNVQLNMFESENKRVIYRLQNDECYNSKIDKFTYEDRLQFIKLYIKHGSLTRVKRQLTLKYGINTQKSFLRYSKQMLQWLMKASLKKLIQVQNLKDSGKINKQWQLQLLNSLDNLCTNTNMITLRIKLLKYLIKTKDIDDQLHNNIIKDISNCKKWRNRIQQQKKKK